MQATEARAPAATREMFYNEALGDALVSVGGRWRTRLHAG